MIETQQGERAKLLVQLHTLDSAAARAVDSAPIEVVRTVHARVKQARGAVSGIDLGPAGYEAELRRIRLERKAGVMAPSTPIKVGADDEADWPAKADQLRKLLRGGDK